MQKLKIAVVGAGYMGYHHAKTMHELDLVQLSLVVDPDKNAGQKIEREFGAKYCRDMDEALKIGFDAAVVALPDTLHEEAVVRLLSSGKHVLCEKPMAHNLNAAKNMAKASQKGGRYMTAHLLRFDTRYIQAYEAVSSGKIGKLIHASAGRFTSRAVGIRMNGNSSPCFYCGVHDVDAIQWITGANIVRVYSRSVKRLMPSLGIEGEDAIFSTVDFDNGIAGQLYVGWSLPEDIPTGIWARAEFMGYEGIVDLDVRDHGLRIHSKGAWSLPDGLHWPLCSGRIMGDLHEEDRHFVAAVIKEKPFAITIEEALRAVAVNDAILKSCETGQAEEVADWKNY